MAITLPGGFNITNNEPVDARITVANQSARLGFSSANVFEGLVVYQQDTDELYVLNDASDPSDNNNWSQVGEGVGFPYTGSAQITGSLGVTGSITSTSMTSSFSGSFEGDGSGLTQIPASGIVGLNLSQIATTNVTASVSEGGDTFKITSGSSTPFLIQSGSGNVVISGNTSITGVLDTNILNRSINWTVTGSSFNPLDYSSNYNSASNGIYFSNTGDKLYHLYERVTAGALRTFITQYDLTTNFDTITATNSGSFDISKIFQGNDGAQFARSGFQDMYIAPTGDYLFTVVKNDTYDDSTVINGGYPAAKYNIVRHEIETSWDITSIKPGPEIPTRIDISGVSKNPTGIHLGKTSPSADEGTRVYFTDNTTDENLNTRARVVQFNFDSAYSAVVVSGTTKYFNLEPFGITQPQSIRLNEDGTRSYILDEITQRVYEFSLPDAWNHETASLVSKTPRYVNTDTKPKSLYYNPSKEKAYIIGSDNNLINQLTSGPQTEVNRPMIVNADTTFTKNFRTVGNLDVDGNLAATSLTGDGSGLTNVRPGFPLLINTLHGAPEEELTSKLVDQSIPNADNAVTFGMSTALSADGSKMVVGNIEWDVQNDDGYNAGRITTHGWNGSNWIQLDSTNEVNGNFAEETIGRDSYYGISTALSANGNILAVGADFADAGKLRQSGQVYIYSWDDVNYVWNLHSILRSPYGATINDLNTEKPLSTRVNALFDSGSLLRLSKELNALSSSIQSGFSIPGVDISEIYNVSTGSIDPVYGTLEFVSASVSMSSATTVHSITVTECTYGYQEDDTITFTSQSLGATSGGGTDMTIRISSSAFVVESPINNFNIASAPVGGTRYTVNSGSATKYVTASIDVYGPTDIRRIEVTGSQAGDFNVGDVITFTSQSLGATTGGGTDLIITIKASSSLNIHPTVEGPQQTARFGIGVDFNDDGTTLAIGEYYRSIDTIQSPFGEDPYNRDYDEAGIAHVYKFVTSSIVGLSTDEFALSDSINYAYDNPGYTKFYIKGLDGATLPSNPFNAIYSASLSDGRYVTASISIQVDEGNTNGGAVVTNIAGRFDNLKVVSYSGSFQEGDVIRFPSESFGATEGGGTDLVFELSGSRKWGQFGFPSGSYQNYQTIFPPKTSADTVLYTEGTYLSGRGFSNYTVSESFANLKRMDLPYNFMGGGNNNISQAVPMTALKSRFGSDVAITGDGTKLIVGQSGYGSGSIPDPATMAIYQNARELSGSLLGSIVGSYNIPDVTPGTITVSSGSSPQFVSASVTIASDTSITAIDVALNASSADFSGSNVITFTSQSLGATSGGGTDLTIVVQESDLISFGNTKYMFDIFSANVNQALNGGIYTYNLESNTAGYKWDGRIIQSPDHSFNDWYGGGLGISRDGKILGVGAWTWEKEDGLVSYRQNFYGNNPDDPNNQQVGFEKNRGSSTGQVYLYDLEQDTNTWKFRLQFGPEDPILFGRFGREVEFDNAGDRIVVSHVKNLFLPQSANTLGKVSTYATDGNQPKLYEPFSSTGWINIDRNYILYNSYGRAIEMTEPTSSVGLSNFDEYNFGINLPTYFKDDLHISGSVKIVPKDGTLIISGSTTLDQVLTLTPFDPLPDSFPTGSFAVSSSNPPKPYFWDGISWNALY